MNHLTNERGETVAAVGAPGSLADLQARYPDTWQRRANDDQLYAYCQSKLPTHRSPFWVGSNFDEEPSGYEDVWYLYSEDHGHVYVALTGGTLFERLGYPVSVFSTPSPLPKI